MLSYIKILGFFLMHVSLIKYILTNNTFTFALCKMKLFKNKIDKILCKVNHVIRKVK